MKTNKILLICMLAVLFVSNSNSQVEFEYEIYVVGKNKIEIEIQITPEIQSFIRYYQNHSRRMMEKGLADSGRFYGMTTRIFHEEGVPEDLVWISQVSNEWGNNPKQGLWLFRDEVVQKIGLEKTEFVDERLSYEQATRAIARHLKYLSKKYDKNWELVIAAHHSGEQAVDDALIKAQSKDFKKIYDHLPLNERNFVLKVLATILIANNLKEYGFENIKQKERVRYDRVRIPASTDLKTLAATTKLDFEDIEKLNPELLTNLTPPTPYVIRIPAGTVNLIVGVFRTPSARQKIQTELTRSVVIVKAKRGDTVKSLAERHKVSATEVAKFNGLLPMSKLIEGREIKIPKSLNPQNIEKSRSSKTKKN